MSDDLDLRAVHRRHAPDPRFVAELGGRLEDIIASSVSAEMSTEEATAVTIDLEPGVTPRPTPGQRPRWVVGAAVAVAAASVAVFAVVSSQDQLVRDEVTALHEGARTNGWVAFDSGGDIHLVRPGQDARRLDVAGSDSADESCPTWSPDGVRLAFGRSTGSSDPSPSGAELVIVPVGRDGAAGAPTVIALDDFRPLPGFAPYPCATWAPDGRWVAFAGGGEVWVAEPRTGAVRRLPDLRPTDLEWRPGTDELTIAGDIGPNRSAETAATPVTVYSASTGEVRRLGAVRAAHLTWSPDGSTLAYQGGENDPGELRLVDFDGANDRLLTRVGDANHGVGPVWSPTGGRIVYQRLLDSAGERHEVVLVGVADGAETIIDPPQTDGPNGSESWYPFSVSWSPDGTTLLYSAWSHGDGRVGGGRAGVLAVRPERPTDVTVLTDISGLTGVVYDHPWVPVQMWGRQPELDDDRSTDTSSATAESTEIRAFAVPFRFDGPFDDWITADGQVPFLDFDVGPVDGLPQTAIKFAIPDVATPEDAMAGIASQAPSPLVLGDPVDMPVGNMPATCMDVAVADGEPGASLFQVRDRSVVYDVVLDDGTDGWICVADVGGRPVVVLVRAPTADLPSFLDEARALLETVEFCTDCA